MDLNNLDQLKKQAAYLELEDIQKLTKLNKILQKMETAEAEQRKNLSKNPDLSTYTRLLSLLHKNYEISTLTANELAAQLDILNLSIVSAVIQKIVRGFQIQLNMFLHFQINFIKKGQRTDFVKEPTFSSNSIFPEAELLSLGSAANINPTVFDEKKVDLKNKNIRRVSVFKEIPPKRLIPPQPALKSNPESSLPTLNKLPSVDNFDQNIAELNNEMAKQETNLYNLGLMETRNNANKNELQQLSKDIHKKFNIPENPIETNATAENEIKEEDQRKSSLKKTRKTQKSIKNFAEILEESPQNSSPSNRKLLKRDVSKMSIIKTHTRNQGTSPDPDIFDINMIYALEEVLKRRDNSLDEVEETLRHRENNIKELESVNMFLKSDYNNAKTALDGLNVRIAESRLNEANLNIELNNNRKEINILKREIGIWETKFEKRDQEACNLKGNVENQAKTITESEKKIDALTKEIEELKEYKTRLDKRIEETKKKNDELSEENEYLRKEVEELKSKPKEHKESFSNEDKLFYEETIENLQDKVQDLGNICENLNRELNQQKHLLALKDIQNDNDLLEKTKRQSFSINSQKTPLNAITDFTKIFSINEETKSNLDSKRNSKANISKTKIERSNSNNMNAIDEKANLLKRGLSVHLEENTVNIIQKTGRSEALLRKDSIHSASEEPVDITIKNQSIFKLMDLDSTENARKRKTKTMNTWTQTIPFDSDEILHEYLREKDVSNRYWVEIGEIIEKFTGKQPLLLFNPKTASKDSLSLSRKNSLSGVNFTPKPTNFSNYSNIMNKILSPSNKNQIYAENNSINNITNNDSKFIKIENKLDFSPEPIPLNKKRNQLSNLLTPELPEKNQNPVSQYTNQISQINMTQVLQIANNQKPQKPTNFSGSAALKNHFKLNETNNLKRKNSKTNENLSSPKQLSNLFEPETNDKNQPQRKIKVLSNSSSNLKTEILQKEESPRVANIFKEASPRERKELWELPKEEKNVIFENMYQKFSKIQEDLLSSKSDHRKYLKHVVLIKHIKKELNGGEFDGNVQMPNMEEFKEFMERMLQKHSRCGKECSHLKRFYEKIGWNPSEKGNIYSNRIEFKPKMMVINSLPKIN